ncbi:MAG TPA: YceI family protein [Cyclobacteriaceae bacterium]|nr:YceI family protein [Cytophagales bacterium]HMR55815.1 YceI family protein [Cyclobacteriaceae bacterium]HRE65320.1 YceI family protein [Cyclobacteriaceae bacterium]HRF35124.1 YceI family protein [Cyclobacteriaceae bacterium]
MKTIIKKTSLMALFVMVILHTSVWAQQNYKVTGTPAITIAGTSTMHDWTMTSKQVTAQAQLETDASGQLIKVNSLLVTIPAESLKSGKGAMDKNAYNALKTDKNKDIRFQFTSATINGANIVAQGTLAIAGSSKPTELTVTGKSVANGIRFEGSKKLKMTEYNVEPPSFMFGSVKTGDEITITFDITLSINK